MDRLRPDPATYVQEEEETPVQRMYRFTAKGLKVSFKRYEVKRELNGFKTVEQLVHTTYPGMDSRYMRLVLDGKDVNPLDVVECTPNTMPLDDTETWIQLHITERGLRGGVADRSEDEIRSSLSALLQSKGLQGKDLQQKLEETVARIPKHDLQGWAAKGTWQALKQTVGTRITFLSRQKKEHDPWEDSDPWSQALSSKDPKPNASNVLIPQVWEKEDKTTPGVLERPTRGSTGLAIMSPQDFINTWTATSMPASPDELTVVVWPPLHEEVQSIPHEAVIFPARVLQQGSSVTLLKGIAYHLGAKRISLKHEDANEFKTKKAVSLMVELDKNLVDATTWKQITNKPVDHVQLTLGKQIPLLSSWGTRYWDGQDKTASPKDCQRITTNILVAPEHIQMALKISGTNIWISPRSGQEVFHDYVPIWIRGSLTEVRRQHDVLEYAAGIIKGKRGFAVRVARDKMEETKQSLFPGQPIQPFF